MRLFNVAPVQFRTNFLKHDYDAQELVLRVGDHAIVETTRGPAIAKVTGHIQRQLLPEGSIQRVLRRATDADISQAERNESREREGYVFALERIRVRKLPMKLIRAQYMHDGSKIVFYFSADGRIDFRDLVKDLAHRFRTRIEMHQIGVRDGARMLGGIGPCGRELCCSTFLENFAPVSIRMAKDQGLTLNPKKVSGMCGRLMCCLVYEQQVYKNMRRRVPRIGAEVHTEAGKARVVGVDVINSQVTVEFEDTNRRTFPTSEVSEEEPSANQTVEASADEEASEYLWD
ncbi:MAG: regulatory iron-sulfur-containing complex subunit RicT, partial [Myxococcota bacterium]